jgi:DNA-binding NarL/FixJ family response regulator
MWPQQLPAVAFPRILEQIMTARMIRVVIVDEHPLFRAGLRHVIGGDRRFDLVGEAGDGETALKLIQETRPDVAVLDVNVTGLTALEIARKLRGKKNPARLIILTIHKEEGIIDHALDSGVKGFVVKENAVEEIAAGEHYLSPAVSGYFIRRRNRAEQLAAQKPGLDDLTKAERRILKLISEKKTSRKIAAELFISPRTVEAHRANICAKLELRGSHSLLHFALENRSCL